MLGVGAGEGKNFDKLILHILNDLAKKKLKNFDFILYSYKTCQTEGVSALN